MRTLILGLLLLPGCLLMPCGDYEISNTTVTNYENQDYNGDWREICTAEMGSSGVWNMMGDGMAEIWFGVDGRGSRDWMGIDVEIAVGFATAKLVPGEVIELADLYYGTADINPCIDCPQDFATVTEARIEVLSGWTGDDPCAEGDGPEFRLDWDLVFGDGVGPTYLADGKDDVLFSTFVSAECGY